MLSRRAFVGKLAAGAAVAGAVTTIGSRAQARGASAEPAGERAGTPATSAAGSANAAGIESAGGEARAVAGPPPWELLAPLGAGAALGHGWTVAELSGVQAGACVVTLAHAGGRTQRVHLCRNAGAPAGLVHTAEVDLLVMNGGAGAMPTEEGLAQAVAAVAHAVARNESAARVAAVGLVAQAERMERGGTGAELR